MDTNSSGKKPPVKDWPDDAEALLELGNDRKKLPENYWSLNDAFQGVQVFGGTGSGKSSGSGQAIARAFLEANLGGLVLTAKTDEVHAWQEYAKATGRETDLLIVDGTAKWRFNFLKYELTRSGDGAGETENLVSLFCSVLESSERRQGSSGGNEGYWQRTLKQLLRNAIDLAVIAANDLDLPSLNKIITSAPRSIEEEADPKWRADSACFKLIEVAGVQAIEKDRVSDFELTRDYWLREFPSLAGETRSIIVSTFTSMADCFLRGKLRKLFCTDINFTPEDTFDGKVIILNLPVKEHNELGQFSQVLFKYIWQRAVERRIPPLINRRDAQVSIRPVFLWADESQFFANSYDALFQSTARSSRACTVYLTQNLPSYFAVFGGSNSQSEVEAFIGNLQTKIFHANGDPSTNGWASASIGMTKQLQLQAGMSENSSKGPNPGLSHNAGGTQTVQSLVQPQEFTTLKTGGRECELQVDSIIFQGGRTWLVPGRDGAKSQNHIRHSFPQVYGEEPPK